MMKLSDLIENLQAIHSKHGNVDLLVENTDGTEDSAWTPLADVKTFTDGGKTRIAFVNKYYADAGMTAGQQAASEHARINQ